MRPCPQGFFCPKGTMEATEWYGNFTTPQKCRDGTICAQNRWLHELEEGPGASTQFGNHDCQPGTYCKQGIPKDCPEGFYCPKLNQPDPSECRPGFYQEYINSTTCDLCPIGTFCYQANLTIPIKCRPGWTCQVEGSPLPAQLCPGGSFCHSSTVTNQTNSTIIEYYKPNYCFESTYCLDGVATPFVD